MLVTFLAMSVTMLVTSTMTMTMLAKSLKMLIVIVSAIIRRIRNVPQPNH